MVTAPPFQDNPLGQATVPEHGADGPAAGPDARRPPELNAGDCYSPTAGFADGCESRLSEEHTRMTTRLLQKLTGARPTGESYYRTDDLAEGSPSTRRSSSSTRRTAPRPADWTSSST